MKTIILSLSATAILLTGVSVLASNHAHSVFANETSGTPNAAVAVDGPILLAGGAPPPICPPICHPIAPDKAPDTKPSK